MHFFGNIITYSTISRIELVHFRIITSKISEFRLLKINNNISNMREKIAGNLFTRFNGFFCPKCWRNLSQKRDSLSTSTRRSSGLLYGQWIFTFFGVTFSPLALNDESTLSFSTIDYQHFRRSLTLPIYYDFYGAVVNIDELCVEYLLNMMKFAMCFRSK